MRFALITTAALAASVLVGCKEEAKVTPATRAADTQATVVDKTNGTIGAIGDEMGKAGEKIGEKAGDMKDKAAEKTADVKANADAKTSESVTAKVNEQAQKHYDQAMEAVKNKDFSAADSAVENLEKIKPQLSPDWQNKIDTLKSTIETAKKAGAVKIPGVTE